MWATTPGSRAFEALTPSTVLLVGSPGGGGVVGPRSLRDNTHLHGAGGSSSASSNAMRSLPGTLEADDEDDHIECTPVPVVAEVEVVEEEDAAGEHRARMLATTATTTATGTTTSAATNEPNAVLAPSISRESISVASTDALLLPHSSSGNTIFSPREARSGDDVDEAPEPVTIAALRRSSNNRSRTTLPPIHPPNDARGAGGRN